ncbi:anthranilate phosphoribosyltransferase [uncultured Thalassolituus sp.]|uniref:anthranilate phosphoribosyltransferase n=1 Tax=uncultured Thalassolituus sp. TaxID=285273 RepID=UPI00261BD706|nr:anthranilate phosphoribosyltransferase [uncultured Thalassolituus sp.]
MYRFLDEGAEALGLPLVKIADGRDIWQVFRDNKFLANNRVPICSRVLKQEVADKWVRANCDPTNTVLHFGIDWTEAHRADRIPKHWAPYDVEFPLLWKPLLDRLDADKLLEAAGVNLALNAEQVARCIDELGVGFMFAPSHHSAMKHAIGPRKSLGLRTIFNILGPMTNPAGVSNQVIGVFSKALVRPIAEVLQRMGGGHILVVHSKDGLDEISLASETYACELKDGDLREFVITPEDLGIESQSLTGLSVDSAEESLALIKDALGKRETPAGKKAADILALNAGAAIYAANLASSLKEGVAMADDAICSGLALEKLNELVSFSGLLAEDNDR